MEASLPSLPSDKINLMGLRKTQFVNGEFYHIYNRGVDKRNVYNNKDDVNRFFQGMVEFNVLDPIGSIYENSFLQLGSEASKLEKRKPLVNFIAYCINPNHFHFIVEQVADKGIEKLMQRNGTGYTKYFNNKYKRSGSLFQGVFKSIHINSNEYLLHLSAYVNLNDRVHQLGSEASKLVESKSSWAEYVENGKGNMKKDVNEGICEKDIILGQFKNKREYKKFALESLESIRERKKDLKDIEKFLLE